MSRRVSLQEQFARVPLFEGLSGDEVARIAHLAARIHEPAGEVLTKEGERGDELMIVLEGEVEVRHGAELLARLGPGDYLGEVALLDDDAHRTATAVATTAVVIAFIGRHDFDRLLSDLPVLTDRVNATIAQRHTGPAETDGS